jgi:carboxypeptidase family protein
MRLAAAAVIAACLLAAAIVGARFFLDLGKDTGSGGVAPRGQNPGGGPAGEARGSAPARHEGPRGGGPERRSAGKRSGPAVGARPDPGEAPLAARGLLPGDAEVLFTVTGPDGGPIDGAVVALLSGLSSSEASTAATGEVAFSGIGAGVYTYRLRWGTLPEVEGARELTVQSGERQEVPITLGGFDLSMGGRILDGDGAPVPGIEVTARKHVSDAAASSVVRVDQESLRAKSGDDGRYEIRGLDDGDYILATRATSEHPAVRKVYRAGSQSADLILEALREIVIRGVVSSREGRAIDGARVVPLGQPERQCSTDAGGLYETRLELSEGQTVSLLQVVKQGYRETRVQFRIDDDSGEGEQRRVDVVMEPLGPRAAVRGIVADTDHVPVPGETVHLHSASLGVRYQAVSGEEGRFAIEDVQVAGDYRLWIYSRQGYKDYTWSRLEVMEDGVDIEIQLEKLETASLKGVMVDPAGRPVPRFTLWVRSLNAIGNSLAVTGDAAGRFELEGVPEGDLQLETRSLPRFTVRGIKAVPGSTEDATLVLDWGDQALSGLVEDDAGQPLQGANVSLEWSMARDGVASTSWRSAVTDASGRFSFSELSAGDHKVTVNASGFTPAHVTHEVGSRAAEPVLRLKRRT